MFEEEFWTSSYSIEFTGDIEYAASRLIFSSIKYLYTIPNIPLPLTLSSNAVFVLYWE